MGSRGLLRSLKKFNDVVMGQFGIASVETVVRGIIDHPHILTTFSETILGFSDSIRLRSCDLKSYVQSWSAGSRCFEQYTFSHLHVNAITFTDLEHLGCAQADIYPS